MPSSYRRGLSAAAGIEDRIRQLSIGSKPTALNAQSKALSLEISKLPELEEDVEMDVKISGTEPFIPQSNEDKEKSSSLLSKDDKEQSSSQPSNGQSSSPHPFSGQSSSPPSNCLSPSPLFKDQSPLSKDAREESPSLLSSPTPTNRVHINEDTLSASPLSSTTTHPNNESTQAGVEDKKPTTTTTSLIHSVSASSPLCPDEALTSSASTVVSNGVAHGPSPPQGNELHNEALTSGAATVTSNCTGGGAVRGPSPPLGNGTDQLKVLTAASRPGGGGERMEGVSPVRSERSDYEKLTMEAAALSREKWKQSEGV